jgi:hypothetical protein
MASADVMAITKSSICCSGAQLSQWFLHASSPMWASGDELTTAMRQGEKSTAGENRTWHACANAAAPVRDTLSIPRSIVAIVANKFKPDG